MRPCVSPWCWPRRVATTGCRSPSRLATTSTGAWKGRRRPSLPGQPPDQASQALDELVSQAERYAEDGQIGDERLVAVRDAADELSEQLGDVVTPSTTTTVFEQPEPTLPPQDQPDRRQGSQRERERPGQRQRPRRAGAAARTTERVGAQLTAGARASRTAGSTSK